MEHTLTGALTGTPRSKAFEAAREALLIQYKEPSCIPRFTTIGTVTLQELRNEMTKYLRRTKNNDVAEYLDKDIEDANIYLKLRVRSLRRTRNKGKVICQSGSFDC